MALSTRSLRKQGQIFDAAEHLFLRKGLRGVTMEGLAKEAGVTKATLYAHFPDKEAVFAGVVVRFHTRIEEAVVHCLAQDKSVSEKLSDALVEKSNMVHRLLKGSPHADELLSGKKQLYQDQPKEADQWIVDLLVPILAEHHDTRAADLAPLLASCAQGILGRAQNESELAWGIRKVVDAVLTQDLAERAV
ncbi:TetR/AcrR family transcriptional regulator [Epibacterium ulvae]|uniref:TetR/AcrR family transcriptional regulator n=1 Tax=Epibacterium ulvae TaxID=1156985 RepID=UPI001BFCD0F6|nr:TetR/AcrR family transcriptional regulator [Epibacterium ulvae]MBT8155779.1 TetR/AcrR family transcriptional regulator [Epibacterium ulvae]